MSTINTKIKASYFEGGIRLPFESPSCGEWYTASGPVTTYKLSPEELARYGPAKAMRKSTVYNFKNQHQREAEELANRLDRLKAKLTKEQYLIKKEIGMSDAEVCAWAVGEVWRDAMPALKKEWGLETRTVAKQEIQDEPVVETQPEEDIIAIPVSDKIFESITEKYPDCALDDYETTAFDLADEFYKLQEENNDTSQRIAELMEQAEANTRRMDKIREALEAVKVAI
jgi:hypothetical protein